MNMDGMGNGLAPWLDQPVMLHSSRADKCTLSPEQCAYRNGHWRYWYQADHVYGLNTIYFFVATIGICVLGFWGTKLATPGMRRQSWWQKTVGISRFGTYRHYNIKLFRWRTPSVSVLFLLCIGAIFFFAMTLGPKPYYWPNTRKLSYGNSPPIATRTGWMALGCTPFVVILSTKANMIASLTGVSHERLIVFHNWVAWAMFALALVHTFPFIVFHIWKGDMVKQWNTSVTYWTGVAAVIPQAYLTFMSLPWIRNKYYEFFKATHQIAAIAFMLFFFLHCDFRLSSWDYFIAAGILYSLSWLYSTIKTYFIHGLSLRATIVPVSDLAVKITIPVTGMTWQPGQHVFLRFLAHGMHAFTAHPFTICSIPAATKGSISSLVFYVRPRGGITGRLAAAAMTQPGRSVTVLLDGPYGGIKCRPLYEYDRSLVIACGSGAAFSLPFVLDWLTEAAHRGRSTTHKMKVIVSTRDATIIDWYEAAILEFMEANGLPLVLEGVEIIIHITDNRAPDTAAIPDLESGEKQATAAEKATSSKLPIRLEWNRADMRSIVQAVTLEDQVTVGIAVCGPSEVLKAVQDEAAAAQLRIVRSKRGAKEVYLHSETFSW